MLYSVLSYICVTLRVDSFADKEAIKFKQVWFFRKRAKRSEAECRFCDLYIAWDADVTQPWLLTSAKQRRDPCSVRPIDSTNHKKSVLNFLSS